MTLSDWAARWNIPAAALDDLRRTLTDVPAAPGAGSESAAQAAIRLEAPAKGCVLWRNNVGAYCDERGRWVRYGLANESKAVNKRVKSADLIGIRPVLILPDHVGSIIGQFISREVKAPGWTYAGTEREEAQARWAEIVTSYGGDAKFATGEGTL